MGFTTGFTGGVTLTLSLAYLSVLAHQRSREQQGQVLRHQAFVLQGLIDPLPPLPPPTRSEVAAAQRANTVEVAKDRWNQEVENAVRWVQVTDWVQVRERLEDSASRLWGSAFGTTDPAEEARRKLAPVAASLEEKNSQVAAAAKGAFDKAKAEGKNIITATKDAVGKAVGIAEDKSSQSLDKTSTSSNPVQQALNQRFEKPEVRNSQTVAEALKERYMPMEKRDNSVLRGL
ncbi:Fc.00g100460.m01.CDS01 [Cosmosporella sp. VM-42]